MIRNYIISNFKGLSGDDIRKSIEESIEDGDDETLPGLGVLFEIFWKNSDNEKKENILNILSANIK